MITEFHAKKPSIGENVFIAPNAWVIGDVTLSDKVSVFFGAVLRGDINPIIVGSESNLQEHVVVHTSVGRCPTIIGSGVTVGHRAVLHGCQVEDNCLIGMGSIILDEAIIEPECLVAAGSLIPEGRRIPARSLVIGSPGRVIRELKDEELAGLRAAASDYVTAGAQYLSMKLG